MTRGAEIERLLEQIRARVDEIRLLQTYGVRTAALVDRKRELADDRALLAEMVSG